MKHYCEEGDFISGQGQVRLERDLLAVEQADGVQILEDVVRDMPELADDGEAEDVPVLLPQTCHRCLTMLYNNS